MFLEGEQVLAKLPNTQEYEKAKVISSKSGKYKVQFQGGVEHTVGEGDIKAQRESRSQSRPRGRGAAKSPKRASPSRRSPARRSPGRPPANAQARKLPVRTARQAKITLNRLELSKDNSSDTDRTEGSESTKDESVEPPIQSRLREFGPATRRSIRMRSEASKAEHEQKLAALRGVDRAASLPVERKVQYNAVSEGKERGLSVQRDDDLLKSMAYDDDTNIEPISEEKSKNIDLISKPQEWGGWIGALLLILVVPIGAIAQQLVCAENYCSFSKFHIPRYKEWKSFLNLYAFGSFAAFLAFVALASMVPIGKVADGQQSKTGRLQYRINGIWMLLLTVGVYGGCVYNGYDVSDFLLKKSIPFTLAGVVYGILLALALYIKGGRAPISNLNIYGSTNSKIYDFWQGREINPRFGSLDIKLMLFRFALIASILINLAAIVKAVKVSESLDVNNLNLAAILAALLQIIYFLNTLVFESTFITTFEITYEGTGYMLAVGYFIYPYLATLPVRYILLHKPQQSPYLLAIWALLYFVGLVIYKMSNSQKDAFRRNPFDPAVTHLETIPTKRGKRLIVSGLWGFVRHPNYLGDIMTHWAIALLSFSTNVLPYILAIQVTLLLIHRAVRDNGRCAKRYGYAWEQYCSRVKYMIFKPIF